MGFFDWIFGDAGDPQGQVPFGCCGNPGNCADEGRCEQPIRGQLQAGYGDDWEKVYYHEDGWRDLV